MARLRTRWESDAQTPLNSTLMMSKCPPRTFWEKKEKDSKYYSLSQSIHKKSSHNDFPLPLFRLQCRF